tara:strand:- start:141 stop:629 length:489 start_codon:yes stop_codon:yes gene_type:complete
MFLDQDLFVKIIKNTPLVSIDICILKGRNILLGKRVNPPAKDLFFVPGGRILKSEKKRNAFKRILRNELGFSLKNDHYKFVKDIGCYEHFYNDNFLGNIDFSTHYVVIAYLVPYESLLKNYSEITNEQHSDYIWFDMDKLINISQIHPNTLAYFDNPLLKNF